MLRQKKRAHAESGRFRDIQESRRLLADSLTGKRAIFVVDARDLEIEQTILRYGMFESAGADEGSCALSYADFYSKGAKADILILRSSRGFEQLFDELAISLQRFRQENPGSALIVCSFDRRVSSRLKPLLDSGVIDVLESDPPNDFELIRRGCLMVEARR